VAELRETAASVAEGVRALQRLTLGPADQLENPADVADVIASLSVTMSLMPALLGQLAAFLEVEHVKGAVSHRHPAGAAEPVRAVSDALHRAGLDAETMAVALDSAHEACAELETAPGGQGALTGPAPGVSPPSVSTPAVSPPAVSPPAVSPPRSRLGSGAGGHRRVRGKD
jgi:hypothetical protein